MTSDLRIGIIGAGYIAQWHADAIRATPGARLVAVCDPARDAAEALASAHGIAAFTDLDQMIAARLCDVVHILTPPQLHRELAVKCLGAGLHVMVEKPVALSLSELDEMTAAASTAGRQLAACHNFLALPAYQRLKTQLQSGDLGRVSSAQINWALPLVPLRSGPYSLWMLRRTENLLLELGPHPYSMACDLFGPLEVEHVSLGQWITLPGGESRPQAWRILARAGHVDVTISLSLVETFDDRSVSLRGSSGMARMDFAADTLVTARDNTADLVLNPLLKELARATGHLREGLRNAARQAASLNQKSPYGLSFRETVAGFYAGIRSGTPDPRLGPAAARQVMQAIADTLARLPALPAPPIHPQGRPDPRVMVIGGTGFIGRNLVRRLVQQGHDVRVISRGAGGPFPDLAAHVETTGVSMRDEAGLAAAMAGMDCVYNLAKSTDKNWDAALAGDIATTERIGRACLAAGVGRLIHTGTIASYDMSAPHATITEATDFGDMAARNIYARAKAEGERRLGALQAQGLALAIARPGIVLGDGGPLQHWGIGRWHGAGAVRLWGNGHNILPFVLADDVSDGLILMMQQDAALGESFNLVGDAMFSGRDYFDAIHQRAGARLRVAGSNLTALWLADVLKQGLKRHALRRRDAAPASLADWKSRGHLSAFDNSKARRVLGWTPETDRDAFWRRAIDEAHLFA
ncbi:Gfo/Idh/MocA family oxidoreductase [Paracoccus sp. (in: a-proteobacteria)]|uniref:Gfo/Idh/MocA family oxidoreductase n=1 Tax=Paracoccus sp. TaxID=267 RepID=UPI00321FD54B